MSVDTRAGRTTVSVKWMDIEAKHALRMLFESVGESCVWSGDLEGRHVTVSVRDVEFETALDLICRVAGLTYDHQDGVWMISEKPGTVRLEGRELPVVGALEVPMAVNDRLALATKQWLPASSARRHPAGFEARIVLDQLPYFDVLVDLDVEDAPLPEVAKKLSVQREGAERTDIIVHDSVPDDIRVTAKVYRMRRDELLGMLMEHADLDISLELAYQEKEDGPFTPNRVYLIRRPEMTVTGSGVPGGGGGRSSGGGGARHGLGVWSGGGGGGGGGGASVE